MAKRDKFPRPRRTFCGIGIRPGLKRERYAGELTVTLRSGFGDRPPAVKRNRQYDVHIYQSFRDLMRLGDLKKSEVHSDTFSDYNQITRSRYNGYEDWYGFGLANRKEILSEIKGGSVLAMRAYDRLDKELSGKIRNVKGIKSRRKRIRGDFGDEIRVGAVMRGNLDRAYSRTRKVNAKGLGNVRKINLCCAFNLAAIESHEVGLYRAFAAIKLMSILERKGFSTAFTSYGMYADLWWGKRTAYENAPANGRIVITKVKRLGQKIAQRTIVSSLMPYTFRCLGFLDLMAKYNQVRISGVLGYPTATNDDPALRYHIEKIYGKKCRNVYVPDIRTKEHAVDWVNNKLDEIFGTKKRRAGK